jgi:hypothetical protein
MQIPSDKLAGIQASTKSVWTMCMEADPKTIVSQKSTYQLQKSIGVHCIPIQIWSGDYDYMFDKDHFKVWSFLPKPPALRFTIPKTAIPAKAAPQTDSNAGHLTPPSI